MLLIQFVFLVLIEKQTNFIKRFYTKKKNVYPDFIKFLLYYPKPKLMQIRLAD